MWWHGGEVRGRKGRGGVGRERGKDREGLGCLGRSSDAEGVGPGGHRAG